MDIIKQLAVELKLEESRIASAVKLMDEGNTIPFIARYRKEVTGLLDDTELRNIEDRLIYLRSLEKRKGEVCATIAEQGVMTEELQAAIDSAKTLSEVEDLYRPYKPKRRTRASIAKEKGLEPLAIVYLEQTSSKLPLDLAAEYVNPEKAVETAEEALAGAQDIIAEMISDSAAVRAEIRRLFMREGILRSSSDKEDDGVYKMYYAFEQPVNKIAPHRVLAIDRGEREDILKVKIVLQAEKAYAAAEKHMVKRGFSPCIDVVKAACTDAVDRLIYPSMEREIRNMLTEQAAESAIQVFALNLRPLLMQPPVKGKVAMGFDPAYRTGCKIAVVDETGMVLDTTVVYPTAPHNDTVKAKAVLKGLIVKHGVSIIAIGNGTASKESEIFISEFIKETGLPVAYMVVSEAGASVYSASKLGAEEFPQYDVSLRSAVSIARRLQDPLAELVKIDPKAIGVGQYQHDMPKARLDTALGGVVESCVNSVGVDVNTASFSLLAYVAGIGASLAKNIVQYRDENGHFTSRTQLNKVPKLGKKAFEQAAGFLRVAESDNPLDNTSVHPESYTAAKKLLSICGLTVKELREGAGAKIAQVTEEMGAEKLAEEVGVGVPTLRDIIEELLKPGRDPRDGLPAPMLRTDVMNLADLKPEMILDGTVRNVTDFGAFVDIGVHQDGLVHISQLCDKFIKHPSEAVAVGDIVKVKVTEVDAKRGRIGLTMKGL